MKKISILFLLLSFLGFSQKTILVTKDLKSNAIYSDFEYFIDNSKNLKINEFQKIKSWQAFDNKIFLDQFNSRKANFNLCLRTNIQNTTNDTLNLVIGLNDFIGSEICVKSVKNTELKKVGYLINTKERDFKEDANSFKIRLLPQEKKQIFIQSYIDYLSEDGLKISLETQSNYNNSLISYTQKHNSGYALFTLLTGGILIMLLYNLLLFFQYKERNYFYYSLYLFFTLFNYSIIADGIHQDFFGNLNHYRDLMIENSYVLSFIFYTIFVYSVLAENTKIIVKKLFTIYVGFMIIYLISVNIVFQINNRDIISSFVYFALLFRIVSSFYAFFIIYILIKSHKNSYLKYIMYGTFVLVFSYFTHVIFNLIIGNSIINHYFNLVGTLIEILFFTYALNLRKKIAEQERDVLIKMNALKSRFFANISHEFRTPLTLIKSPVQSLKSKTNDENQLKELSLIDNNSNRMLELVDQLLELSKLDSGNLKLILKDGNIANFLHTIIESFEFQAKEINLIFISNIQKSSQNHTFDKDVIQKIATNLLSNAFKYSTESQTVIFDASIENQELKLLVSNSGTEVKKEDLPKLFERFYQKKEASQGVGIGLSLVKELVDLYKGKIETNVENGVLSFTIWIPLENVSNAIVIPINHQNETIINDLVDDKDLPILLIVDDNQDIRNVIASIFQDNYTIIQAQDGEQGYKMAQKEIPDCIISDVVMPKMDGFEFTKAIKNDELTSFIPVVLLTAKSSDAYKLEGLQSTADSFLTKPFNNEILKATVNQLISERKKLQKRYSQELVLRPVDIVINSVDEKFLEKLQQILDKELPNSEFTSDNFASSVGMSRMQLHRKLKSLLGVSATEFLRNERLKTAIVLLEKGNGNISEIAYSVGFNDVSYFSKCFKEVYNVTPSEYLSKKNTP
jgi:signal transduction histidine kinase/DNA-binding response OmpR family regulator